jgi:hypothetical protein
MYYWIKYLIWFVVLVINISCIYTSYVVYNEKFQDYKLYPYGEVYSGSDPLYFYKYNRYRKPYRWPYRYYSSYPYPHMEPGR